MLEDHPLLSVCNCLLNIFSAFSIPEGIYRWSQILLNNSNDMCFFFPPKGYFDALRIEKLASNITVTLLCPGPVYSNFLAESFTGRTGEVSSSNDSHSFVTVQMFTRGVL
jgi:hypothetical protein